MNAWVEAALIPGAVGIISRAGRAIVPLARSRAAKETTTADSPRHCCLIGRAARAYRHAGRARTRGQPAQVDDRFPWRRQNGPRTIPTGSRAGSAHSNEGFSKNDMRLNLEANGAPSRSSAVVINEVHPEPHEIGEAAARDACYAKFGCFSSSITDGLMIVRGSPRR